MAATIETKAEFARRRGKSPTCVGQWIRTGKLDGRALVGSGRKAKIRVEIAERQLAARLDPGQAAGNGRDSAASGYALERSRLVRSQAEFQELKTAQARRELVTIAEVEARWSAIIASARARMLAAVARIRVALPNLSATEAKKIDDEIRRALADLGRAEPL